jgi:predicted RNase H-like nuclease (RuvC/YqgF family)
MKMNNGNSVYVVKDFDGVPMRVYAAPGETLEELENRAERMRQDKEMVADAKVRSWIQSVRKDYSREYYKAHQQELNARNKENYRKRQAKVQQAQAMEKEIAELKLTVRNRDREIERLQHELQSTQDMLKSMRDQHQHMMDVPVEDEIVKKLKESTGVGVMYTKTGDSTIEYAASPRVTRRMSRPEDLLKRS